MFCITENVPSKLTDLQEDQSIDKNFIEFPTYSVTSLSY